MQIALLVLSCLVCLSHGRRVQAASESQEEHGNFQQVGNSAIVSRSLPSEPLDTLAKFLLSVSPAVSFNPSSPGGQWRPTAASHGTHRCAAARCSEPLRREQRREQRDKKRREQRREERRLAGTAPEAPRALGSPQDVVLQSSKRAPPREDVVLQSSKPAPDDLVLGTSKPAPEAEPIIFRDNPDELPEIAKGFTVGDANLFIPKAELIEQMMEEERRSKFSMGAEDSLTLNDALADIAEWEKNNPTAAAELGKDVDDSAMNKVINTLGRVLTFNFSVIIILFAWFFVGAVLQLTVKEMSVISAFQYCWPIFILPLLTTHMTLTFLSAGLEKLQEFFSPKRKQRV